MTVIKNGTLVLPTGEARGDIIIENGKIFAIGENLEYSSATEVIDAGGKLVFPGFIDAHTHLDMDNGVTVTADDFESGTKAAIAGGTTTIIDFATQAKGGSLCQALGEWREKAEGASSCDYAFHMAICDWNPEIKSELPDMKEKGVTSFKLYMAYQALQVDDGAVLDALKSIRELGGILGVHCENGGLADFMAEELVQSGITEPSGHPMSRPDLLEAEAVNRLLYISRLADYPVNIVHLSSLAALNEVRTARGRGQSVYVETCPQYLTLDESKYLSPGFEGAKYVISPPLRKKIDVAALSEAVQNGEIDTIATDHCSYRFDTQKSLGRDDFRKIPNGAPGIEHRPSLIYSKFVHSGRLTAMKMAKLLSENPARLFGMYPKKGVLRPGSDADIVIWNPGAKTVISAENQYQNTDYTPYEGMSVYGRAERVLLRGKTVVRDGKVISGGCGRYVARGSTRAAGGGGHHYV